MAEASVSGSATVATSPRVAFEIDDTGTDTTLDGTRSSQSQHVNESRLRRRTKSIGELAITLPETTAERFLFWTVAVILACLGLWVALRQTAISEWTAKKDYWEHCQDSQYTEEACKKAKATPLEPPPVSLNWARPKVRSLPQSNTQPMDTFPKLAILFVAFPVITVAWLPFRRRINRALRRPLHFTVAGSQPLPQHPGLPIVPDESSPATTLVLYPHSVSTSTDIDSVHCSTALRVSDIPGFTNNLSYSEYRDLKVEDIYWSFKNRFPGNLEAFRNNQVIKYTRSRTVSQAHRHDVWSLGVLYLEFVAWLLVGPAGAQLLQSKGRGCSGRFRKRPRMITL